MRAIVDSERDAFIADYPSITESSIPPWGGVTEWHGLRVLVFFDAVHQMRLSDITDRPELLSDLPRYFNPDAQSWWYQLPSTFATRLVEVYTKGADVTDATYNELMATLAAMRKAAGDITSPAGLGTIAIVALVIAAVYFLPRGR